MVPAIVTLTIAIILLVNLAVHVVAEARHALRRRALRGRALRAVTIAGASPDHPTLRRIELQGAPALLAVSRDPAILDGLRRDLVSGGFRLDTVQDEREAAAVLAEGGYQALLVAHDTAPEVLAGLAEATAATEPTVELVALGLARLPPTPGPNPFADALPWPARARDLRTAVRSLLARRAERLAEATPEVQLVTPERGASPSPRVINVPAGLFFAPNHTWIAIQPNGEVRVGIDEFTVKLVTAAIDDVDLPLPHERAGAARPLFSVHQGTRSLDVASPIAGRVTAVNPALTDDPDLLRADPYTKGWVCCLEAENLARDLAALTLGEQAVDWYAEEIARHLREREAAKRSARRSSAPFNASPARA